MNEENGLCVKEILCLKKNSPGKSYSLCYRRVRLNIIKMVYFSVEINEVLNSASSEVILALPATGGCQSFFFGSCLQSQILVSYVCVTIGTGVCKTDSVLLSSNS